MPIPTRRTAVSPPVRGRKTSPCSQRCACGGIATRTRSEDLLVNTTPFGRQTYETWSYDANNLVERYTRASVVKSQNLATGCYPDALTAPRDDWRYRYAPFMEREQKRQVELSSGEYQLEGLAWVYYGLGGDKKQLSVWNGVQGTWCLQNNHVFLWPVEYNSYGPMNTRIITRAAGGTKEIVFTDHLGSTVQVRRGTPEYGADQRAYTAFGEDVNLPNEALMGRTGYIGRETDNESALGFYGVRQYDAGYGRFLSVDPLWSKYTTVTPYHYSLNSPLTQTDFTGLGVEDVNRVGAAIAGYMSRMYEQGAQYLASGQGWGEASGTIVRADGGAISVTDENFTPGTHASARLTTSGKFDGSPLIPGLAGSIHTHTSPESEDDLVPREGTPPGGIDIFSTGNLAVRFGEQAKGFISFIAANGANFAVEIESVEQAVAFFGQFKDVKEFNAAFTKGMEGSSQGVRARIIEMINSKNTGVRVYETTSEDKSVYKEVK